MYRFSAYLSNVTKSQRDGKNHLVKIQFPTTKEQIQECLRQIGVDGIRHTNADIKIVMYDIVENPLAVFFPPDASLDELNYISARLSKVPAMFADKVTAAIQYEQPETIAELINLTYNLDRYALIPQVQDFAQLGEHIARCKGIEIPEEVKQYFDYERLAWNEHKNHKGFFTTAGFCYPHKNLEIVLGYDGKNVPQEYRVFSYPTPDFLKDKPKAGVRAPALVPVR